MNAISGKMVRYSNSFAAKQREALVQTLHFDRSDIKFVAVASKTKEKYLVSEDSDYNTAIKNHLLTNLKIQVLDLANAIKSAR